MNPIGHILRNLNSMTGETIESRGLLLTRSHLGKGDPAVLLNTQNRPWPLER